MRMSGRRSSRRFTTRSSSSCASTIPARSRSSMIAVAKRRLGKDHHARRRLQQVGAGARADDEEEGVLHLAMQPEWDAGQGARTPRAGRVRAARGAGLRRAGVAAGASAWASSEAQPSRVASGLMRSPPSWRFQGRQRRSWRPQPGHAQFPQELRGVDDVGGIGGQRDQHALSRGCQSCRTTIVR